MTAVVCATWDTEHLEDGREIRVLRQKARATIEVERDPRTMNRMDPETRAIHVRLEEWACWAKDRGILGYPRQSLTEKAAQYGKLGIPQESNYRAEPMMPPHVAAMDAAISRLCQIDKGVIKTYYLHWEPIECMARRHSMRTRQFQNVLRRARWRLAILIVQAEQEIV